jgi:diketogulonate reductase-like aldo/keto reductase
MEKFSQKKSLSDTFVLNTGYGIPCIGFDTWQTPDGKTSVNSVKNAIEIGYRHIDTAAVNENENSVGQGIRESGIDRKELFITTKLWNTQRGYEPTLKAFDTSLKNLNLDYIDLYLIHWPSNKANGSMINSYTWRAFEKLQKDGLVRSIGVSNFLDHHLQALLSEAEIVPAVNQIEYHPGQMQPEVVEFCATYNILVEAWNPLSGRMLNEHTLTEIAAKYGKTVTQICIRWILQNGILPLPKSMTTARIRENADVFDFVISDDDIRIINAIPYFGGSGQDPDKVNF